MTDSWFNTEHTAGRGRRRVYSDAIIESMLTLQAVFNLPLRQTTGLMTSLLAMLQLDLPVPSFSTLCRRRKHLSVCLPRKSTIDAVHLVVDSTGLKVFGHPVQNQTGLGGEWFGRKYFPRKGQKPRRKPRLWRKIHLGIDEASGEILAAILTTSHMHDKTYLAPILDQVGEPLVQVTADGGYDYETSYITIEAHGAKAVIPPRRNATINRNDATQYRTNWVGMQTRNSFVRRIRQVGRKRWKQEVNYHRRSLAETGMYRLKTVFGPKLRTRNIANQSVEMLLRCKALNMMTQIGMPLSVPIG